MSKIGIVGISGGWSSEKLTDAVNALTGYRDLIDLSAVCVDLGTSRASAGDLDLAGYDALIIKKIAESYSSKVLDSLDLLAHLEAQGTRIFSRPEKMAMVVNRLTCTLHLARGGLPLPPTVVTADRQAAVRTVERYGRAILKPLFTSKARGMVLVEPGPDLDERIAAFQKQNPEQQLIYVQKCLNLPGRDLGLVFLGGKYLATYARVGRADSWNTTTANGGRYQPFEPPASMIALADRAQRIFGLDFTCVDMAETADGPVVFEVSAFGGFRGLEKAHGLDAAELYARYVVEDLKS